MEYTILLNKNTNNKNKETNKVLRALIIFVLPISKKDFTGKNKKITETHKSQIVKIKYIIQVLNIITDICSLKISL